MTVTEVTWEKLQVKRLWLKFDKCLLRYLRQLNLLASLYVCTFTWMVLYHKMTTKTCSYYLQNYCKYRVGQWNNHQCEFCRCCCSSSFPFFLFFFLFFVFLFFVLFFYCLVVCLCFCFSYIHFLRGGEKGLIKKLHSLIHLIKNCIILHK